ncbi:MAG: aminotransferase class I/II-fold pyridoxal phosphate-dependent enzyme [Nitrospinota bacterium]
MSVSRGRLKFVKVMSPIQSVKECKNIASILKERGKLFPEDPAYSFFERLEETQLSLNYFELDQKARAVAATLQKKGIRGERALLIYPTGLDFITAFMGCLYSGVIAIPVWPPTEDKSIRNLKHIIKDANPALALTNSALKNNEQFTNFSRDSQKENNLQWIDTGEISNDLASNYQEESVGEDDIAYLQYTSGSTSDPKGVKISHRNIIANARLIEQTYSLSRSTIGLSWLPHYHDMGLVGKILSPIYTGCQVVFTAPQTFIKRPLLWLQAISRFKATISSAPNYAYDICASLAEKARIDQQLDLSSWEVAISGGEPVKASTLRRFTKAFSRFGLDPKVLCPSYGLAESTLLVTGIKNNEAPVIKAFDSNSLLSSKAVAPSSGSQEKELVSSGSVTSTSGVLIVSPVTLNPCRESEVGEVWIDTPSVARGFWNNGKTNGNTFHSLLPVSGNKEYLRTGDLGFISEGHLYITGRKKDLIILAGKNYYPQDLEAVAEESHPDIRKNSCAAFQSEVDGEDQVIVVAELKPLSKKENFTQISAGIRSSLTTYQNIAIDKVFLVKSGSLPKTASGKIQRFLCRQHFEKGTLEILSPIAPGPQTEDPSINQTRFQAPLFSDELKAKIVDKIISVLGIEHEAFDSDETLYDLGLSSLRAAELGIEIEEICGCKLSLGNWVQEMTVSQVLEVIQQQCSTNKRRNGAENGNGSGTWQNSGPGSSGETGEINVDSRFDSEHSSGNLLEVARNFTLFDELRSSNQMPFFQPLDSNEGTTCIYQGKRTVMLGSNNYLGLSSDPRVREAAAQAVVKYGPSMTGSRLLNGTSVAHEELEKKLAEFLGYEAALVFTTGYQANLGLLSALMNKGACLLLDDECHASIYDGAILSGCIIREFKHNDVSDLEKKLSALPSGAPRMVIVDGVYSMKGDIAPLPEINQVCKKTNTPLVVDEAHALGVLGASGKGTQEHFKMKEKADILTGTFSKSFASIGGWVAGETKIIDWIRFYGRPMLFSASLPPSSVAAASVSMDILKKEPWRLEKVRENINYFTEALLKAGFDLCDSKTPILAIRINNDLLCVQFAKKLLDEGVFVNACVYPAVQKNSALIRTSVIATHEKDTLDDAVEIMARVARQLGIIAG